MIFLQFFLDKGQWKLWSNQLLRPDLDNLAVKFIILPDSQKLPSTSQTTNCLTSDSI